MLAFLANDGSNSSGHGIVVVVRKDLDDILERTKNEVGESCGQGDGIVKVCGWELVFAWKNRLLTLAKKALLGIDGVEFLLLYRC